MSYDRNTKILSGIEVLPIYHPNLTIGEFLLHYLHRDSTRIVQTNHDDGVKISAGEMARLGCQIAAGLLNHVQIGDVIGIVCKNTSYVAPLILGGFLAGTPVSTLDPIYRSKEISHAFNITKPKIVFCDGDNISEVKEGLRQCKVDCNVLTVDEKIAGNSYLFDICETSSATNGDFSPKRSNILASKNCAAILCSSGTTGLSKGCMLSHQQCMGLTKAGPHFSTLFCFSSLYWGTGFSGLMQSLGNNINRVITKYDFTPELLVEIIEKHKVHAIVTPPEQIALLLKSEVIKKADFSTIWVVILTGGPMDVSLRKEIQNYLKNGSIVMFYATTEHGSISSTTPFEPVSNSCGKPFPNTKVKVIDDDGKSLDVLEIGEICVFNPYIFLGYKNNKEETEAAFESTGWLRTGDLGYITEGGEIFLTDRKKEVFDQMNYTVYPSELESWIGNMNGVKAVCVVGIRHASGWRGAAVVVKEAGSFITEKDIVDEVDKNFLSFKRLHGGAYFVDSLPMTSTGKIKRLEARAIAEKMSEQKQQKKTF